MNPFRCKNWLWHLAPIILIFGFIPEYVMAQADSTATPIDTLRLMSDQPLKSPGGAVMRSAIIPGWGQVYNRQHWKAGLAFGINAFLAYRISWYHRQWRRTKNPDFQGKRNLHTWYLVLGYLLTMVDAYVDASLYKFDEAMQISQQIDKREGKWLAEIQLSFRW